MNFFPRFTSLCYLSKIDIFLHFRNAQSPCNTVYKHESAIAHSLARAKHRKMLNDLELNQFSDVSQYYQQNIERMTKAARDAAKQFGDDNHLVRNMRQKIAQWRKEQDSLSMRYKIFREIDYYSCISQKFREISQNFSEIQE